MPLPCELYRLIICHATCVPRALDTSYEHIICEDRRSILAAISDSMDVKRSLSLVSKAFNDTTKEYLYEIITFHRYKHIPHVVKLLSTHRLGRWCRRLDIHLGQRGHDYRGEDWDGSDTLWGLIPSCPNVAVFNFHGWYLTETIRQLTAPGYDSPLVPSVILWKVMAMSWASSLRRIEMSGIWMREDRFELFIRYFRNLEACRITLVEPFYPDSQTFDGDEEPTHPLAIDFRRHGRIPSIQYMDTDAISLLQRYREIAAWPPHDGTQPYTLPSLHTLHIDHFLHLLSHFRLPNVRFLGAYNLLCPSRLPYSFYSQFALVSSTFCTSLTRFTWGSNLDSVDFCRLFDAFPHLTHLKVLMHHDFRNTPIVAPLHPQTTLTHLNIIEPTKNCLDGIYEILSLVRSEMFPNLVDISISCRDENVRIVQDAIGLESLPLGVRVQISGGIKWVMPVLPQFPAYP